MARCVDPENTTDPNTVKLSTDGGNALQMGSDGGLYVNAAATGGDGGSGGGTDGADAYTFTQATAATTWTITHNLGYDPAGISVVASDGSILDDFGMQYVTPGAVLRLLFDVAVKGTAYLS